MNILFLLIFVSLLIGAVALTAFIWSLGNGQYEDLEGAAERILYDEDIEVEETVNHEAEKRT